MARHFSGVALLLLALGLALSPPPARAADAPAPAEAGWIYVPVYSHILIGDNARPFPLAVTVCLRNTSASEEISVLSADYYDSEGRLLQRYLQAPRAMKALSSLTFTVAESEKLGGAGAKFIVTWKSARPAPPPLAEAVMIGTANQQGISFTSRGENHPPRP